jgi:hypothetical protein
MACCRSFCDRPCASYTLCARERPGGELELTGCGDQRLFRLSEVGAVDGEQQLPLFHRIAGPRGDLEDAALIGREYRHGALFVEGNPADGLPFDLEDLLGHRLHAHRLQLILGELDTVGDGSVHGAGRAARTPAAGRLRRVGAGDLESGGARGVERCIEAAAPSGYKVREERNEKSDAGGDGGGAVKASHNEASHERGRKGGES